MKKIFNQTFRMSDFILWSLIALGMWEAYFCRIHTRMDVSALGFQLSLGNNILLLHPLLESESSNETCQKSNISLFSPNMHMFDQELSGAKPVPSQYTSLRSTSRLHAQVTCLSCHHCVVFHIWQIEINLIGNVTNPDRMSTKTLSFPNRCFFWQALHFCQRRLFCRNFQSLQASLRSETLLHHPC